MQKLIFVFLSSYIVTLIKSSPIVLPFHTEKIPLSKLNSFLEIPESPVFSDKTAKRDCVEMCIGTPEPQCFKLIIQSGSFFIWVKDAESKQAGDVKFNVTKSQSLERTMIETYGSYSDDSFVVGIQGKDYFFIQDKKIGKVNFLITKKSDSFTDYEGMIGLGYTPNSNEEKFCFLNQLFNSKIIYHKVFTQSFHSSGKGELSFGEIPQNIVDDYAHYGRCAALDKIIEGKKFKNKNWQCAINGIYYGDKYDQMIVKKIENSKVSFFSYRSKALMPLKYFEYLENTFFKEAIEKEECEVYNIKSYTAFLCNLEYKSNEGLNLVFGDWVMKIPADKIFVKNKKLNKLEFIFAHKKDYEKWTLGRPVVRQFHMVYDLHNEQIGFYNEENVEYIGQEEPVPPKVYHEVKDEDAPVKPSTDQTKKNIFTPVGPDNTEDGKIETNGDSIGSSKTITIVLGVFVVLIAIMIILFSVYMYAKYRRKTKFRREYFLNTQNIAA